LVAGQQALSSVAIAQPPAKPPENFAREIQPILEERCLSCHGPEKQESGFRVDRRETLLKGGDSETPAILPGRSGKSELITRITEADPASRMPPEGKPLTPAEIASLRNWIDSGALMPERFEQIKRTQSDHWSFQPVRAVQIPASEDAWINNQIDALVLRRLHQSKLAPAPMADRRTLIRRVTFDLTGLPPTP
jgi:mono/diheme cytochrome c family protein